LKDIIMLLLVGSTGDLGSQVLQRLVGGEETVRCLIRTPLQHPGSEDRVEVVGGDLTDPASLERACEGVNTVVATATAIARRLGGEATSIKNVDEIGMRNLVDIAGRSGVQRFVYVSFAGADAALGSPLERAKLATEQRLNASSMRVTILRPDAFQEIHLAPIGRFDMAKGKVAVFGKGDTPHRWVSTADVAALVAAEAIEPSGATVIEFGGPEALSRNQAIHIAEQLTGRTIRRQRMPRFAAKLGMRLLDRRNDALASVFGAGLAQDLVPANWDDSPLRQHGIRPRSATEFLQGQARTLAAEVAVDQGT
jgi:uncharacterized protein YbjT (DUF2867 family)